MMRDNEGGGENERGGTGRKVIREGQGKMSE
jgi:hypothetical protein